VILTQHVVWVMNNRQASRWLVRSVSSISLQEDLGKTNGRRFPMVLTTPQQIKEVDVHKLRQEALVSVSGYFYAVDLGTDIHPQHHRVGKDRRCTCSLGADCPAVLAVIDYLRQGGERAPDVPSGYYPVVPQACPVCGAKAYYVPGLTSRRRGIGWACERGSETHYWEAHVRSLRQALDANPWLFPPVQAADGRQLYPGLKREEVLTESQPWPEGYNPDR